MQINLLLKGRPLFGGDFRASASAVALIAVGVCLAGVEPSIVVAVGVEGVVAEGVDDTLFRLVPFKNTKKQLTNDQTIFLL